MILMKELADKMHVATHECMQGSFNAVADDLSSNQHFTLKLDGNSCVSEMNDFRRPSTKTIKQTQIHPKFAVS